MKLKQMKIYSPVMMLGVISILNGCSSKEGTMTNSTSQVEYEQKLEQDISIKEIYNQAANILLEADEKLSEQTVEDSSKGNTISSVEAIQNINTFADLLQKYKDSSEDNKKIIQGNLEQIDIKKEIKTVLEYIVNGNQEAEVIDKATLRSVTLENNQEKLFFLNESGTISYTLSPTTKEMNNIISLFWGNTEETLELSKEAGSESYYNFLSLFTSTFKDFVSNINDYRISPSNDENLSENTFATPSIVGFIYDKNHISNQINYEIQEALNMVKEQYCEAGEMPSDYEIRPAGEINEGWIIRHKNNNEDYMILEGEEVKLVNAVGELQPITAEMIVDYNTVENIVVLDNAKQAYQNKEQQKK